MESQLASVIHQEEPIDSNPATEILSRIPTDYD